MEPLGGGGRMPGSSLLDDLENDLMEAPQIDTGASSSGSGIKYRCACGAIISDKMQLLQHTQSCVIMQKEGFASFSQFLNGILDKQIGTDKEKLANLRAIFEIIVPQLGGGHSAPKQAFGYPKMDEKDEPMEPREPQAFMGYKEEKKEAPGDVVDASNMDGFMAPAERERAQTFYLQLQREREDQLCKFCEKVILDIDM